MFSHFTLAIQQNIYFSHFPWQQFNVQLRKYKARGLIASGYTIQTSWWDGEQLRATGTLYSFSKSLSRNILPSESKSWSRAAILFTIKKNQASTRMLGSVCTTFEPGNCWSDEASNALFFDFFFLVFSYFRTLKFSQIFNSSSTFKYIIGLSLKTKIWLCILCTVSIKLCTTITVRQVCWSAGKVVRV